MNSKSDRWNWHSLPNYYIKYSGATEWQAILFLLSLLVLSRSYVDHDTPTLIWLVYVWHYPLALLCNLQVQRVPDNLLWDPRLLLWWNISISVLFLSFIYRTSTPQISKYCSITQRNEHLTYWPRMRSPFRTCAGCSRINKDHCVAQVEPKERWPSMLDKMESSEMIWSSRRV